MVTPKNIRKQHTDIAVSITVSSVSSFKISKRTERNFESLLTFLIR